MGDLATVFQAEVLAIQGCVEFQNLIEVENRDIHICSDGKAAVTAPVKTTTKSLAVWNCKKVIEELSEANKNITLTWISIYQVILLLS